MLALLLHAGKKGTPGFLMTLTCPGDAQTPLASVSPEGALPEALLKSGHLQPLTERDPKEERVQREWEGIMGG